MKHPIEDSGETSSPGSWSDNGYSPCTIPTPTPSQSPGENATLKKRLDLVDPTTRLKQNGGEYKKFPPFKAFDPS